MTRLGYARRVPLAISGALRRFAQDPARGWVALERAVPRLRATDRRALGGDGAAAVDMAVALDRLGDAEDALALIAREAPERASCALAVAGLGGHLDQVAAAVPTDARGRRAVRSARRRLAVLGEPITGRPLEHPGFDWRDRGSVLHVVTNSLPVTQAGSTIRTQRVVRAQRDLGWDARVVTRPGYPVTHGDLGSPDPEVVDGVPYHRLLPLVMPPEVAMRQSYAALLHGLVARLGPDVLHAASDHVNAAVALEVGRARGLPVAYEARTFFEDTWLARHGGEAARSTDTYRLLRQRHTEVLGAVDVVTTLGVAMRDEIIARGVDPARVFITPNAVPVDFLLPRDQVDARTRLGIEDALWIGSIATINDDEGLDSVIDAVARVRDGGVDARVLIVGDGPALPTLIARAARMEVPIAAPGRVPVDAVLDWYDVLDVFALPRRDTSVNRAVTALKPLEAQARGIPVIGSDLPAVAEVLAPGSALVPPGDVEALAGAIEAWADPGARAEAGEQARAWVATTRTWPCVMESYGAAYSFLGAPQG